MLRLGVMEGSKMELRGRLKGEATQGLAHVSVEGGAAPLRVVPYLIRPPRHGCNEGVRYAKKSSKSGTN